MEDPIEKVKLENLNDLILRYSDRARLGGVKARNQEVLDLWSEYETIRNALIKFQPSIFGDLREVNIPVPDEESSFGRHSVGEPVFRPGHFTPLENEVKKAIKYFAYLEKKSQQNNTSKNVSISASHGGMVNVNYGTQGNVNLSIDNLNRVLGEIRELGIDEDELSALREIIAMYKATSEEKINLWQRSLQWLSGLSTKIMEKGLSDNFPVIIEKVSNFVNGLTHS